MKLLPQRGPDKGKRFAELTEADLKPVKVRAIRNGVYRKRIAEGTVFMVPKHLVSKVWMEEVNPKKEAKREAIREDAQEQIAELTKIKGIGQERAMQLINAGVGSLEELLKAATTNEGRKTLAGVGGISTENLPQVTRQAQAILDEMKAG